MLPFVLKQSTGRRYAAARYYHFETERNPTMSIYTLGIDIGSTASKCVMLKDGKEIVSKSLIAVGAGTSGPQRAMPRFWRTRA